ncbi:MAG: immune inhibitor A [Actinomycetota bacterium]|nr:immune inhibitor A [Actinomycetota bacterium]
MHLTDEAGKHLATIDSQTDAATQRAGEDGWVEDSVNLSRFAGTTVKVSFLAKTYEEQPTTFYVDDVTLE